MIDNLKSQIRKSSCIFFLSFASAEVYDNQDIVRLVGHVYPWKHIDKQ